MFGLLVLNQHFLMLENPITVVTPCLFLILNHVMLFLLPHDDDKPLSVRATVYRKVP